MVSWSVVSLGAEAASSSPCVALSTARGTSASSPSKRAYPKRPRPASTTTRKIPENPRLARRLLRRRRYCFLVGYFSIGYRRYRLPPGFFHTPHPLAPVSRGPPPGD